MIWSDCIGRLTSGKLVSCCLMASRLSQKHEGLKYRNLHVSMCRWDYIIWFHQFAKLNYHLLACTYLIIKTLAVPWILRKQLKAIVNDVIINTPLLHLNACPALPTRWFSYPLAGPSCCGSYLGEELRLMVKGLLAGLWTVDAVETGWSLGH